MNFKNILHVSICFILLLIFAILISNQPVIESHSDTPNKIYDSTEINCKSPGIIAKPLQKLTDQALDDAKKLNQSKHIKHCYKCKSCGLQAKKKGQWSLKE
tara:strand:+ start:336 stop:638 length:303 start_codon:yes stop_codon:yes gene_type:complete